MRSAAAALLLAAASLAPAAAARAADGEIEIDQARALAGGVTPGDAAGFPVTLSRPGSYRLSGNLVVTNANADAIGITSSDVALDLAGFEIRGPVTCSGVGSGLTCAPSGSSVGVRGTAARSSVRKGHVVGFARSGLSLGPQARVEEVTAESNAGTGIVTGEESVVRESIAYGNKDRGFEVGAGSLVDRSVAAANRSDGVRADIGSSLVGAAASANGRVGVFAAGGSVIDASSVNDNGSSGVDAINVSTVTDGALVGNGGNGIYAGPGSNVQGNAVRGSASYGVALGGDDATFRENTITSSGAAASFGGVDMLDNSCNGGSTCP